MEPKPEGELVVKTIAMPADTNRYGDMFGGWLVSQMDLGGAILAHKFGHQRMTTVAIDRMVFIRPVYVGDVVSCFATVAKRGNTSIGISIEVWVERIADQSILKVTEGLFTYVAIDDEGRPTPIQWKN
ncbi:MAG: acyl-CoA thioesterase [Gammaproteobacteria bacterium]|jgi:acyl-CoA thioesterase YciA|nr:acyl-CoA thioesterase [Gammaproteobacteria bacterium]